MPITKQMIGRSVGLLVIAMCCVSGCGEGRDDRIEVRFSYWASAQDNNLWKQIVNAFEEDNPDVKIKREWFVGDYGVKIRLVMVSQTAADIILMDDEIYPGYDTRGYLEDLGPYIERDREELAFEGDIFPTALESFNYRNRQGGLPWDGNVVLMFYNKDLFDKAGLDYPTEDWTTDEFREMAKKLTVDYDGDGRTDQFGTLLDFGFLPFEPFLWTFGGRVLNEDKTKSAISSPEAVEAAQFIYDMKFKDHSIAHAGEMEGMILEAQLLTGRLGMTMAGSYMISPLNQVKRGAMRWGLERMPIGPRGHRFSRVTWDGVSINKYTTPEKKEIAWRFIKHLLSEPVQKMIAEGGRGVPVRRSHAEKYYVKPETEADEQKVIDAIALDGRLTPVTAYYLEIRSATQYYFDALRFNNSTPKEAIMSMGPHIDEALHKELTREW